MANFFNQKTKFLFSPKRLFKGLASLLAILVFATFSACQKELDYFQYVSELRDNIFLAETEELSLRIYSVAKEQPYAPDGVPQTTNRRIEAYLIAPEGDETCRLSFTVDGREYGGEMSFDNVKTEYYYACALDVSALSAIPCRIEYGEKVFELTANSVRTADTLTPKNVLKNLKETETELFSSLTDKYGFAGEIYLRLIYEDSPYYYVGVIDRTGKVHAFLINAVTGKILAKRTS